MKQLTPLRKILLMLALFGLLTLPLTLCVCATDTAGRVSDGAGLLTDEEEALLAARIEEIATQYGVDAVIVTVHSLDGKSPAHYAGDYYDAGSFGLGQSRDGILMLLAMESRDYYFLLNGSLAYRDYTPIEDEVLPCLSRGDYYEAFDRFLDGIPALTVTPSDPIDAPGSTVTYPEKPGGLHFNTDVFLVFAVIGIAAGFLTTFIMKQGMKTARARDHAADYVRPGSFDLRLRQDIFLYHTRRRVRVQSNTSSGSRGGGFSGGGFSGGGRSGGGGKF